MERISDTASTTSDGRTVVDARKLFTKPHVQDTLRRIREKGEYKQAPLGGREPPSDQAASGSACGARGNGED